MESWNLPFQISRRCEVGITDNVNIVIGADFLAPGRIGLPGVLRVNYSSGSPRGNMSTEKTQRGKEAAQVSQPRGHQGLSGLESPTQTVVSGVWAGEGS